MKYIVIAHAGAKISKIEPGSYLGEDVYHVYVQKRAIDGQANKAILESFAEFLGVKKYELELVSGHKSKRKIFTRL